MATNFSSKVTFITNKFIQWIIVVGISSISAVEQEPNRLLNDSQAPVTTTVITVIIDEVNFHPPWKWIEGTEKLNPLPKSLTDIFIFPNSVDIAVPELTFKSFLHSLRTRILMEFLQIERDLPATWIRDKLSEGRINSIKDLADVFLFATRKTMWFESPKALLTYGIDEANLRNCEDELYYSRPGGRWKEWIEIGFTVQNKPISRSLLRYHRDPVEPSSQKDIDQHRQERRKQCVDSNTQSTQENGWLMAAGIALQHAARHIEVIPLGNLMNEIAIEWCDLLEFQSEFIKNEDADERDVSWRTSDWYKVYLRHPGHDKTADWLSILSSGSFASNPSAQLLIIEKIYNRRGFELSERVQVQIPSEGQLQNEPVLESVLKELKRNSALVLFGHDEWQRMGNTRSDLDISPLMVMRPSASSYEGYYHMSDTCGLASKIPDGSDLLVPADIFRGRNFEVWFADVQSSSDRWYPSRVRELETVQGDIIKLHEGPYASIINGAQIHFLQLEEESLENQIDELTMKQEPTVPRPSSPVARNQGNEPICWMFAAAKLLRSRQLIRTPFSVLISELKEIQSASTQFADDLNELYRTNEHDAMKYWIDSDWYRLSQTPGIKRIFRSELYGFTGNSHLISALATKKNLASQDLMLQRFFLSHELQFSEMLYDWDKEQKVKLETLLAANEHALIIFSGDSWDKLDPARLPDSPPTKAQHTLVLESFEEQQNEFILVNSHGPKSGSAEKGGRIRVSGDVFFELEPLVYTIEQNSPSLWGRLMHWFLSCGGGNTVTDVGRNNG